MVAESTGVPLNRVDVSVEGDLDLRGTLGVARKAPVGFAAIRTRFEIDAPEATPEQIERLKPEHGGVLHGPADADGTADD